jgi:hypothetical protein
VDGLRGYPDDQESRWLPDDRGEQGFATRYGDDRYRVPEPRHAGPVPSESHPLDTRPSEPHPLDTRTPIGPRSGVELPPLPPPYQDDYLGEQPFVPEPAFAAQPAGTVPPTTFGGDPAEQPTGQHHTQPIDRSALRRPPTPGPTVYRTRRAGIVGVLGAVAIVAELLLVRVLLAGEFGHTVVPGAVVGGLFAMTGVPLVAMGLYALMTGAAAAAGPTPARAWLRTPLAYLPIGLVLLIAAGLATG